jgi:hypothetical protein
VTRTWLTAIGLVILTALAWIAWSPSPLPPDQSTVQGSLTEASAGKPSAWRVVTRRLVWGQAAKSMQQRLQQAGFSPILMERKENVPMHAFDDATIYPSTAAAAKAAAAWKKLGFEANIIETPDGYLVGLGRFFIASYAEQMQTRLKQTGRPYRYQQRMVEIPTFRFTFAPTDHDTAKQLWQRLQNLGIADPVLMPASRFAQMYGNNPSAQATQGH